MNRAHLRIGLRSHSRHCAERIHPQIAQYLHIPYQPSPTAGVRPGDHEHDRSAIHSLKAINARCERPIRCKTRAARQARTPVRQHRTIRESCGSNIELASSSFSSKRKAEVKGETGASVELRKSTTTSPTDTLAGEMNFNPSAVPSSAPENENPPKRSVRKSTVTS